MDFISWLHGATYYCKFPFPIFPFLSLHWLHFLLTFVTSRVSDMTACFHTDASFTPLVRGFSLYLYPLSIWILSSKCFSDINECAMNRDSCTAVEICENTVGSFRCRRQTGCGTGYTLDAATNSCQGIEDIKWSLAVSTVVATHVFLIKLLFAELSTMGLHLDFKILFPFSFCLLTQQEHILLYITQLMYANVC